MKVFERYTLEELHDDIGRLTFIDNRRNYEINYKEYVKCLESENNDFPEILRIDEAILDIREAQKYMGILYILLIHILEIPLEDVPLYLNSWCDEVKALCEYRLKKGK